MTNKDLKVAVDNEVAIEMKYNALRLDYEKLLIQVQAELVQKEYYKNSLINMSNLCDIKDSKISRLELALRDVAEHRKL